MVNGTKKYGIGEIFDIKKDEKNYICVGVTWDPMDPFGAVIKIDENRNEIWNRIYGTQKVEYPVSIEVAKDGYVILSQSEGSPLNPSPCDFWVFKIDKKGNMVWSKIFGMKWSDDIPTKMVKTKDGFLLIGWTNYTDNEDDIWLIKIDENGNEI